MRGPARFRFLNVERQLEFPAGWTDPGAERLWLYNLHYFDDLVASGFAERAAWHQALIERWIADNPPAAGVGWEPFPTSLRIANWVKWAAHGGELPPHGLDSLAVQLRWLERRLEYHLLGNHLLTNAWALVLGGLFFTGPEADRWLGAGWQIYDRQLPEQILPDGGHYERSPMYHSAVLEQLLDVVAASEACAERLPNSARERVQQLSDTIARMRAYLAAVVHPDGQIALFNDAALDIAPDPGQLEAYARRLGLPELAPLAPGVTQLADSGYVRIEQGPAVAILDVAPLGPDFLPGHAHADTLSFELSLFGRRLIVNSGTSTYADGPLREWQRSTAAHNTLELAGESSSEMWGSFRVGRRARAQCLSAEEQTRADGGTRLLVSGMHDGYRHLDPDFTQARVWILEQGSLCFSDAVWGQAGDWPAVSRLHLHPEVELEPSTGEAGEVVAFQLAGHGGRIRAAGRSIHVEPSRYYPRFGVCQENRCLEFDSRGANVRIEWD